MPDILVQVKKLPVPPIWELTPAVQSATIPVKRTFVMAEKLDPKETVSFEELLMSNVVEQEALVNLLEAKGLITKAELLEEIKNLPDKQKKLRKE
jgi:hypothetical protein